MLMKFKLRHAIKSATYAKARMRPRFLLPFTLPGGLNRLYESIATTVFILVFYYD